MATHTGPQVKQLQESALVHLWVYLREPSDMAEKGEPQIFVEGKGCQVTDALGNTYTDAMSGLWLKNVGYGRTEIADAAYQQMLKLTYMPMGATTEPTVRLAEKIASITPGDLSRCFFTSGGSESVETAMKLSRAYFKRVGEPTRVKFISRKGSYHGATFGTLALGGTPIFPKLDYEPLLAGCFHGPQPNPYRCEYGGTTPEECAERCVNAIEDIIKFQGPETVAAVVAEPIASPQGAVVPGPNYWPMLREVCDRHGCLLIADEVITGFGRTGKMFACQHWDVTPDIMTVAKGITSGYIPMGGGHRPQAHFRRLRGQPGGSLPARDYLRGTPGGRRRIPEEHRNHGKRGNGGKLGPDGTLPAGRPGRTETEAPGYRRRAGAGTDVRHGHRAGPADQGILPRRGGTGATADPGLRRERRHPAGRRRYEHHASPVHNRRRSGRPGIGA